MSEKKHLIDVFKGILGKNIIATSFSVDSREVKPGSVFFALDGAKTDGHNYLSEVKERGAIAALVKNSYSGPSFGMTLYHVNDPFDVLEKSAKEVMRLHKARIIAVTGSLGKTTSKDFITEILRSKYKVSSTKGNQNSKIGLPLSILNEINGDEEYIVLEMGMTKPGHISKLVDVVAPHIALITSIAYVHAENFSSIEEIAKAKAEILSHPKTEVGIIQHDIAGFSYVSSQGRSRKVTYSLNTPGSNYHISIHPNNIEIEERGNKFVVTKPDFPVQHVFMNALGAAAVARECNMSWDEIMGAFQKLTLPEKRLQKVLKGTVTFINDAYNAAEPSVKGALDYLLSIGSGGKKIAVLGSMKELGIFSEECHRRVGEYALKTADELICLGQECRPMVEVWEEAKRDVSWYNNIEEIVYHLHKIVHPFDCILLKGSRSLEMWKVMEQF